MIELNRVKNAVIRFVEMDRLSATKFFFNKQKALKSKVSTRTLRVGRIFNQCASGTITQFKLPIYGNWCGPGHGGGKPVDRLDYCCMRHDLCYKGYHGKGKCACDKAILYHIKKNWNRMRSSEKEYAAAIYTYFSFIVESGLCAVLISSPNRF